MTNKMMMDIPIQNRPREKMAAKGATSLTDGELIAILLGTGTKDKSALDMGEELTAEDGLRKRLASITHIQELLNIKGLGPAKAATVLAALEIGRRLATAVPFEGFKIQNPSDVWSFLSPRLRYANKEQFIVVFLNSKNKVIGSEIVSEGILNGSVVHPREVYKPAILRSAASIVVAHNHPSGDITPSREDRETTEMLYNSGKTLGIPLLDHLIIGDGKYYSFKEAGEL